MQSIGFIGIPFDESSSYKKGAAKAPDRIREALYCECGNLTTENQIDLSKERSLIDFGNLRLTNDIIESNEIIEKNIYEIINNEISLISLGGDHSITYPILKAFSRMYENITIIQFDAHPDLYNDYKGNIYSHASTFTRILENNFCKNLTQIGIRANTEEQIINAKKFKVETITMTDIDDLLNYQLYSEGVVYLSIDIDCLDPAFAPGVSHPEPGGFSTRLLLDIIGRIESRIIGADIVEYNPDNDINNLTAKVCSKILKEIAGKIIRG